MWRVCRQAGGREEKRESARALSVAGVAPPLPRPALVQRSSSLFFLPLLSPRARVLEGRRRGGTPVSQAQSVRRCRPDGLVVSARCGPPYGWAAEALKRGGRKGVSVCPPGLRAERAEAGRGR